MLVTTQKRNQICTITINRKEVKNAVDGPTATALADAFRKFEEDEESNVAILCGAGHTFCAGADLKAVAKASEGRFNTLAAEGDGPMGPSRMVLSKPVIAAISGYAVAGGLELALWCDMRVMEDTAVLGIFCRRFGVPLIDGGTIRLPRLIGMSRAMDLILTGRPVEAEEALSMGLVNRVVGHGHAITVAEELAGAISKFPQTCMRSDRLSAYEQWNLSLEDALLNEFHRGMEVIKSGETLSGASRFTKGIGKHGSFYE